MRTPRSSFVFARESTCCRLCDHIALVRDHGAWRVLLTCPRCGAREVRSKFRFRGRLVLDRAARDLRERGILQTSHSMVVSASALCRYALVRLEYHYFNLAKSSATFFFMGRRYHYFLHEYNLTWRNERTVEVPIFWDIVTRYRGKEILEVGNVLSHYFPADHDVVDKYEKAVNVVNADIVDYRPSKKYDLIISISTLEHVGWDDHPRDSMKVLRAIENLKALLAPCGKMMVSLPLGQNPNLDRLLNERIVSFSETYYLKRISRDNRWIEAEWKEVQGSSYGQPFPAANGLVIGVINSEQQTSSPTDLIA